MTAIEAFFKAPEGLAIYGVLVVAIADFLLGVAAAFRDNTFQLSEVAAWLRKHLAGRVVPIAVLLGLGYFANQAALTALGASAAAIYVLETIGSIRNSWGGSEAKQPVPED